MNTDGWVSTKDRFPISGVFVLVVYHGVVQYESYAWQPDTSTWVAACGCGDDMPKSLVSHWMALPDTPE